MQRCPRVLGTIDDIHREGEEMSNPDTAGILRKFNVAVAQFLFHDCTYSLATPTAFVSKFSLRFHSSTFIFFAVGCSPPLPASDKGSIIGVGATSLCPSSGLEVTSEPVSAVSELD